VTDAPGDASYSACVTSARLAGMEWWLLWAWRFIAVLGIGGVLVWMGRAISALKTTVDAQKETISAQAAKIGAIERLLTTMETVLKSTDEPAMLERLTAYKQFVDKEKEALVARHEEQSKGAGNLIADLVILYSQPLPFVPTERRTEIIAALPFGPGERMKTALLDIAQAAPDFTRSGLAGLLRDPTFASARHDVSRNS
jgi:hypothetical protein